MDKFKVVCIEEDYFSPVKIGEVYTVTDIIELGSEEETYILEEVHPDGQDCILVYSNLFISLDEWREIQIEKIGI